MSRLQLKQLAEELEQFAASVKPKPVIKPSVQQTEDCGAVARSILGYAMHRAPEGSSPELIGEAIAFGIRTAADELALSQQRIYESLLNYLENLVTTVRDDLSR